MGDKALDSMERRDGRKDKWGVAMPIRWSALKVKEATDRVEEIVNPILEPLEEAKKVVAEARKIPNLPEYMGQRLAHLEGEIERVTGYMGRDWVNGKEIQKPYMGYIHRAIEAICKDLPAKDLAGEQAQMGKLLNFFNGDREKAELAMNLGKPKPNETPKEQVAMAIQVAYNPVGEAIDFFSGSANEQELDGRTTGLLEYDHNIGDAGHDGCEEDNELLSEV